MGYTHYWELQGDIPQDAFDDIVTDAINIIELAGVDVAGFDGTGYPVVTSEAIVLNGRDDDNDGAHETFSFKRQVGNDISFLDGRPYAFCKTARKPYDVVVAAILLSAQYHCGNGIVVSSDGNGNDFEWVRAATLYMEATRRVPGLVM